MASLGFLSPLIGSLVRAKNLPARQKLLAFLRESHYLDWVVLRVCNARRFHEALTGHAFQIRSPSGHGRRCKRTRPSRSQLRRGTCQLPRAHESRNPAKNSLCPGPCTCFVYAEKGFLRRVPREPAAGVLRASAAAPRGRVGRPCLPLGGLMKISQNRRNHSQRGAWKSGRTAVLCSRAIRALLARC